MHGPQHWLAHYSAARQVTPAAMSSRPMTTREMHFGMHIVHKDLRILATASVCVVRSSMTHASQLQRWFFRISSPDFIVLWQLYCLCWYTGGQCSSRDHWNLFALLYLRLHFLEWRRSSVFHPSPCGKLQKLAILVRWVSHGWFSQIHWVPN